MFYKHYRFTPKLLPSLATLVLLPVLLSLGFWQLGRMHEKQDLLNAQSVGALGPALNFTATSKPTAYSKIEVRGRFLSGFSILLQHQMHNSVPGYHVLTALEISSDLPLLWVNRGWVARDQVPKDLELSEPSLDLMGLIQYPSENRFILGENFSSHPDGILKIQRIAFSELSQHFARPFYPFILLLDPSSPGGYIRDWEIKTMPPSKHLGYAVQWFALAATLLGLYIIVNLQRKTQHDQKS